jgi:predicted kinase
MSLPVLIITIGLPRSGKSTWAMKQNCPVVNPDSIRLALSGQAYVKELEPMVWTIAKYMVRSLFLAGHPTVIVDATNGTRERRSQWVDMEWATKAVVFTTSPSVCRGRAVTTDKAALLTVIDRMMLNWVPVNSRGYEDIEEILRDPV